MPTIEEMKVLILEELKRNTDWTKEDKIKAYGSYFRKDLLEDAFENVCFQQGIYKQMENIKEGFAYRSGNLFKTANQYMDQYLGRSARGTLIK